MRHFLPVLALAACVLAFSPACAQEVTSWRPVQTETVITFSQDSDPPLPIVQYKADIVFEAARLASSHINMHLDLKNAFHPREFVQSANMRNALDVMQTFSTERLTSFDGAALKSKKISSEGGAMVMEADLTINGVTQPVNVPLQSSIESYFDLPKLVLTGSFAFDPRHFSTVAAPPPASINSIRVNFKIVAIPGI